LQISIIIINYKCCQLVVDCIQSIYKQNSTFSYEIIVVDNNSEDGSREKITSLFPDVMWIDMNYNSGFARANNEGIRQSTGEVVLLLNPDTIVEDDAINKCYYNFAHSDYAACGIQILNPDNTPQVSGLYAVQGGLNFLLQLPYAGSLLKFIGNSLKFSKPNVPVAIGLVEVDWINGAFLMVKRTSVEKAGLLDEDFFLYAEETEWCSRLKKTGKLCIYGGIHIIHLQAGTTLPTFQSEDKAYKNIFDKKGLQIMVSTFVRIRKEFGVAWFFFILLMFILEIPVFLTGVSVTFLFMLKNRYTFNDFFGYVKNVGKTTLLSYRIVHNKPYFYKML
jgi:GT2 family glycosyltransferase